MITGKGREALATEGLERTWVMVKLGDWSVWYGSGKTL
jgi:hypothetical protein